MRDDGNGMVAPRALRRMEAALLDAEAAWRGGVDAEVLRRRWEGLRTDLDEAFAQARDFPAPRQPRSLGLADAPRPSARRRGRQDARRPARQAAGAGRRAQAGGGREGRGEARRRVPRRDEGRARLRRRPRRLRRRGRRPAPPARDDPVPRPLAPRDPARAPVRRDPLPAAARRTRRRPAGRTRRRRARSGRSRRCGGRSTSSSAASRPRGGRRSLAWVRPLLDRAAQSRHEGLLLLWERGYAPPDRADALLTRAENELAVVRIDQDAVEDRAAGAGRSHGHAPRRGRRARSHPRPRAGLGTRGRAGPRARPGPGRRRRGSGERRRSSPGVAFQQKVEALRRAAEVLRAGLDDVRRPFATAADRRPPRREPRSPRPGRGSSRTWTRSSPRPSPPPGTRARLWAARSALARQLLGKTLPDRRARVLRRDDVGDDATPGRRGVGAACAARGGRPCAVVDRLALARRPRPRRARGHREGRDPSRRLESAACRPGTRSPFGSAATGRGPCPGSSPSGDLAGLDALSRVLPASVPAPGPGPSPVPGPRPSCVDAT